MDGVPEMLLDAPARRALLNGADTLACELSRRGVGLGLRLQGPATGDLVVAALPRAADKETLSSAPMLGAQGGEQSLQELVRALADWRDPDSWLARSCASLLLVLDASIAGEGEPPPPHVYVTPFGVGDGTESGPSAANAFHADPFGLLSSLAAITGSPIDFDTCHDFKTLIEALPAGAELVAAGAMLSGESRRPPRIALRGFGAAEIKPFLKAVGRKAAAKALTPIATRLEPVSTDLGVALEIGPHATDTVGLEVHAGSQWSDDERMAWRELLTTVVDLGLADSQRAQAVLQFIGDGGPDRSGSGVGHVTLATVGNRLAPTRIYVGSNNRPSDQPGR